jgi:2',3'-cyclic-nucleotide 2'-phosphodiesterase (5'-nucleotidase family)
MAVALLGSLIPAAASPALAAGPISFTILDTNDVHGQLEASNADPNKASNPGLARTANVVNAVRNAKGAANVLLVDAGDEMQGSLLSNLGDGTATGKGKPTIATFNAMGYDVATFGNHEFDWGQVNLANRTGEATYPYVTANIVKNDTGNCATAGWQKPDFADAPYQIETIGTAPNAVKVAFIGVTTTEVPIITVASATAGLCFKDPTESIKNYYGAMKADGADVIVVLSHLGYTDGGYGYGIPVIGDQTLAANLIKAGKPVDLIVGGHSHTSVAAPGTAVTVSGFAGKTTVVQSAYNGRRVGQADVTVGSDGSVAISWKVTVWTQQNTSATPPIPASVWRTFTTSSAFTENADVTADPTIDSLIKGYASNPDYLAIVNEPVGYSAVDLPRSNTGDNMMGTFIDDAIYKYLNTDKKTNGDPEPANDVDVFFNNAGGIRTDWCYVGGAWVTSGCVTGARAPALLTYGDMFTVLPFGNATAVGTMTGAQILEVLNYAPNVAGVIQPAGLKYKYFSYKDTNPGPQPYAWGAFDACVVNKTTKACDPLDLKKTYKVGTNEFLAPAGGDGYNGFKYMKNITYWGDMLNAVNAYVSANYGTSATAYAGPNGDGTLDGRIIRDGTDTGGSIVPVTILHHNDSHGNLVKGPYVAYTQLATLIKQERLHNPDRTLLLNGGDSIQGDAMSYYFKSAPTGFAADGTPLPPALQMQPFIAATNPMGYDAMTLGNHEFNFGSLIFKAVMGQAKFPVLGANVTDTGAYGLAAANEGVGVQPYIEKTVGPEGIKVAILGITNHRVPNYELPSNIPGLTFSDPLAKAQELSTALRSTNDAVIALTHIGFTEDPKSVDVDKNVDTNMAKTVTGLDAIVGSHSHTNPATGFGDYKYLPTIVADPNDDPVIISQAYRYNNTLGEIVLGMRAKAGGYEVVSRAGRYLSVTMTTTEDAATKTIIDPYVAALATYNNTVLGQTTTPIDALQAYTQETNGANLQADAAVFELNKHGITPDIHISGAMTNSKIASTATPANPYTLKVSDMFAAMPYENSLVVLSMNGPQLKAVLERAYRNYYYYKYVPGYGGYSYYTTCMLDTNFGGQVTYNDLYPAAYDSAKTYVVSLKLPGGRMVDFADASTYFNVSTVNYLAAGSCNFNNGGVSLWPLSQIVNDTQYYVRDAVIDYIKAQTLPISPAIEGRLSFIIDTAGPVITITSPTATVYLHTASLTLDFGAVDVGPAGLLKVWADLDGTAVGNGQVVDLLTLSLGSHTLTVHAVDKAGNASTASVAFTVKATVGSLKTLVNRFFTEGKITKATISDSFLAHLTSAEASIAAGKNKTAINQLNAFINAVKAQQGKAITSAAATLLIADANWVISHLK